MVAEAEYSMTEQSELTNTSICRVLLAKCKYIYMYKRKQNATKNPYKNLAALMPLFRL